MELTVRKAEDASDFFFSTVSSVSSSSVTEVCLFYIPLRCV